MDLVKLKKCKDIPEPPIGPPCRTMKESFWSGLIETEESKQRTKEWQEYISLYRYMLNH